MTALIIALVALLAISIAVLARVKARYRRALKATLLSEVTAHGPGSGFQLAQRILAASNIEVGQGDLYPALRELEREGRLVGAWEPTDPDGVRGGLPRRVYALPEAKP